MHSQSRRLVVFALAALTAAHPGRAQPMAVAPDKDAHWVGTWGSAPQRTETKNLPPPPGLTSNTLRQVVHVSIGGKKLRVRFSNAFGNGPVTIAAAHLGLSASGSAIKAESDKALTFAGKPSVTIPPGEMLCSDPTDFDLRPLSDVAVTIHFQETPKGVTGHPGSRATSYLQAGDSVSAVDMPTAAKTQHWYILTGIDMEAENSSAAIVTLGDSITDGRGSETDGNNRWPDNLARRLNTNAPTAMLAIINEGIGGNAVLYGGLGPTALSRFERDVLDQNAVHWLIVLEGVNDIGGSHGTNLPVAQDLIAAYGKFIDQAHAQNIHVYGATITPFGGNSYYTMAHETARQTVNNWIRTSGKFDAVIDFDAVVRDPTNTMNLLSAYDSGDHLHLNVAGYKTMADAIDLKLFEK
jgi:lysophospholipase L1-like esterase